MNVIEHSGEQGIEKRRDIQHAWGNGTWIEDLLSALANEQMRV